MHGPDFGCGSAVLRSRSLVFGTDNFKAETLRTLGKRGENPTTARIIAS